MRVALPDTNVLLALAWPNHQFHAAAHDWFARAAPAGWATCALTQLAFLRFSCDPRYASGSVTPYEACLLLAQWTARPEHTFWVDEPPPQPADFARALGHRQVSACYLLRLAEHHGGTVVTFDPKMRVLAGQPSHLTVLPVAV